MEINDCNLEELWLNPTDDAFSPGGATTETTEVQVTFVSTDSIGVSYNTMPGNRPNSNGNYVALWQNSNSIPWNSPPEKKQVIGGDTPNGDAVFKGLDLTRNSYIVGYAVGPELDEPNQQKEGNVVATAFIPKSPLSADADSDKDNNSFQPSLTLAYIGTNSLAVKFYLPRGIRPVNNGGWIALWRASSASHDDPPIENGANRIDVNAESGTAYFNGIKLGRGETYTVGLLSSGWHDDPQNRDQKPLACSITFNS